MPETASVGLTVTGFRCRAREAMTSGIKATSNGSAALNVATSSRVLSALSSIAIPLFRDQDEPRQAAIGPHRVTRSQLVNGVVQQGRPTVGWSTSTRSEIADPPGRSMGDRNRRD